jgi:hypothetical protein
MPLCPYAPMPIRYLSLTRSLIVSAGTIRTGLSEHRAIGVIEAQATATPAHAPPAASVGYGAQAAAAAMDGLPVVKGLLEPSASSTKRAHAVLETRQPMTSVGIG